MFFVSGITGQVGGAAARHLLEQGREVRSLSRDPSKAGEWSRKRVDVRQGDFGDTAAVAGALDGVEGAFLMLPPFLDPSPDFAEARTLVVSLREALRLAPPPRLVALSSVGSQQDHGLGLITATHLLEQGLADLPYPTAFLRPGSFLENYTHGLEQVADSGTFDTYLSPTSRAVPMIATEDIGKAIARLLVGGWSGKKALELGSRMSSDDLAIAMGEVLGRPVQAKTIPRDRWTASLEAQGMPPRGIVQYEEMQDGLNSGWIDFGVPGTESIPATVTPAQVFEKARSA